MRNGCRVQTVILNVSGKALSWVGAMVRSTSPGAGSSASASNALGSAVAAGLDDDPIVDECASALASTAAAIAASATSTAAAAAAAAAPCLHP